MTSFLAQFGNGDFGVSKHDLTPASDAFAYVSIGLIFMILSAFALAAYSIYRRGKSPNREQALIEDLAEGEKPEQSGNWERESDWWKKS